MRSDFLKNKFIVYSFDLEADMFNNYLDIFKDKVFEEIDINDFAAKEVGKAPTIFTLNNDLLSIMQKFDSLKERINKKNINNLPIEFQDYSETLAE